MWKIEKMVPCYIYIYRFQLLTICMYERPCCVLTSGTEATVSSGQTGPPYIRLSDPQPPAINPSLLTVFSWIWWTISDTTWTLRKCFVLFCCLNVCFGIMTSRTIINGDMNLDWFLTLTNRRWTQTNLEGWGRLDQVTKDIEECSYRVGFVSKSDSYGAVRKKWWRGRKMTEVIKSRRKGP